MINSLKRKNFRAIVLNPTFLTVALSSPVFFFVFWLLNASNSKIATPHDPLPSTSVKVALAINAEKKVGTQTSQERWNFNLHPSGGSIGGTVQSLVQNEGVRIRDSVTQMIADQKNPNYNLAREFVTQDLIAQRLRLLVAAEYGTKGKLSFVNPQTGKETGIEVSPSIMALLGVVQLEAVRASTQPGIKVSDLSSIHKDITTQEQEKFVALLVRLTSEERQPLVNELLNRTVYGLPSSDDQKDLVLRQVEDRITKIEDQVNKN